MLLCCCCCFFLKVSFVSEKLLAYISHSLGWLGEICSGFCQSDAISSQPLSMREVCVCFLKGIKSWHVLWSLHDGMFACMCFVRVRVHVTELAPSLERFLSLFVYIWVAILSVSLQPLSFGPLSAPIPASVHSTSLMVCVIHSDSFNTTHLFELLECVCSQVWLWGGLELERGTKK